MTTRGEKINNFVKATAEATRIVGSAVVVFVWFWLAIVDHHLEGIDIVIIALSSGVFALLCFLLAALLETFTND